MHRWAMKGVDENVQNSNTLCNKIGRTTTDNALVTCDACLALMRPVAFLFPGVKVAA